MDKLRSKRDVLFAKVKWELSSAESLEARAPSFGEVSERTEKLTQLAETFDTVQTEIEEATTNLEEIQSIFNHRTQFNEAYYQTKDLYSKYLATSKLEVMSHSPGVSRGSSRHSGCSGNDEMKDAIRALLETQQQMIIVHNEQVQQQQRLHQQAGSLVPNHSHLKVKLPQLNVPVFRGDRKLWRSFKDLFETTIHSRTDLKDAVKMQYLFSYLDGEAKQMVGSFPISDANYTEAWETLVTHYDKKKYTVFALVREFIEQPSAANATGLKKLVNTADDVIRQLKALGPDYESRDPWLIHMLLEKVDKETCSQWARKIIDIENPSFAEFLQFLQKRCDALETCSAFSKKPTAEAVKRETTEESAGGKKSIQAFHASTSASSCAKCSREHNIFQCDDFKSMGVSERHDLVVSEKLCFNCLRPFHNASKCTSKSSCRTPDCNQRHHTLLCQKAVPKAETESNCKKEEPLTTDDEQTEQVAETSQISANTAQTVNEREPSTVALLPTVVAKLRGDDGKLHNVRILIDCGAQASLITEACAKRLKMKRSNALMEVTGVNGEVVGTTAGTVTLALSSRFDENITLTTQAYILGRLTAPLPCQSFNTDDMPYLKGLELADPNFNKTGAVDVILGSDVFLSIWEAGQVQDGCGKPVAQRTKFGWIVAGRVSKQWSAHINHTIVNIAEKVNIDRTPRFWNGKELHAVEVWTPEEERVIDHVDSTLTRTNDGRFIVNPPKDDSKLKLGDSLSAATKRLRAIEPSEVNADCGKSFYLPPYSVLKKDRATAKSQVVPDVLPRSHWSHVATKQNPADCASRGITHEEPADEAPDDHLLDEIYDDMQTHSKAAEHHLGNQQRFIPPSTTHQPRGGWRTTCKSIKPDQLVLTKNDGPPPVARKLTRGRNKYQPPILKIGPLPV